MHGRGQSIGLRNLFLGSSKEGSIDSLGGRGLLLDGPHHQIGLGTHRSGHLNAAGELRVVPLPLQFLDATGNRQHSREMTACRCSRRVDRVGIDLSLCGVRAEPSHCGLGIFGLGRKRSLTGQSMVDSPAEHCPHRAMFHFNGFNTTDFTAMPACGGVMR